MQKVSSTVPAPAPDFEALSKQYQLVAAKPLIRKAKVARHTHKVKSHVHKSWNWFVKRVRYHAAFHHAHHLAYCVYYGIALAEDHGIQFFVVGILFVSAVTVAIAEADF